MCWATKDRRQSEVFSGMALGLLEGETKGLGAD